MNHGRTLWTTGCRSEASLLRAERVKWPETFSLVTYRRKIKPTQAVWNLNYKLDVELVLYWVVLSEITAREQGP